jgi:hypothetical protein
MSGHATDQNSRDGRDPAEGSLTMWTRWTPGLAGSDATTLSWPRTLRSLTPFAGVGDDEIRLADVA